MRILRQVSITLVLLMGTATVAFAGVENVGQNAGEWFIDQLWYIALAVVAFMLVRYLMKKAWAQAGVFFVVGGILVYVMGNPEQIQTIGESLFGLFFK